MALASSGAPVIDLHCHRECGPAAQLMKAEADRIGHVRLSFGNELTKEVNRRQLIDPKQALQHQPNQRFEHPRANALWQMDFKGYLTLPGGTR